MSDCLSPFFQRPQGQEARGEPRVGQVRVRPGRRARLRLQEPNHVQAEVRHLPLLRPGDDGRPQELADVKNALLRRTILAKPNRS